MYVKDISVKEGTLQKLKNLLDDSSKGVQGVFYTNTFFSRRYLARAHTLVDTLDVTEDTINLTISSRVESVGLLELENTLDVLTQYKAGDIPNFTPETILEDEGEEQLIPQEIISANKSLYSADIYLRMKNPKVTYQEFTVAGSKFSLVNLDHYLGEDFAQTVSILFGDVNKLYFFSNFYNKKLTNRDMKIILDLLMDENITGKAILGVQFTHPSSEVTATVYPYGELISAYKTIDGSLVFGTGAGAIRVPRSLLKDTKMELVPIGSSGKYEVRLSHKQFTVFIFME